MVPGTSCFPNPSLRAVQQNIPTAYIQFWSGAIDYQVMKNSVLSFEYTGSKGTHEYDIANLNAGGYGSAFLGDARTTNRLNYQYTNINYRGSEGFNKYNGLNVKFQTNNLFNKGLYLNANYTWSHAIDNLSSASPMATPAATDWATWIRTMPTWTRATRTTTSATASSSAAPGTFRGATTRATPWSVRSLVAGASRPS